jgi:hypothetical protein
MLHPTVRNAGRRAGQAANTAARATGRGIQVVAPVIGRALLNLGRWLLRGLARGLELAGHNIINWLTGTPFGRKVSLALIALCAYAVAPLTVMALINALLPIGILIGGTFFLFKSLLGGGKKRRK